MRDTWRCGRELRARPIAVIWVHGWGANFYYPTYSMIGRALAERGYTGITANTHMHDLANIEVWRGEKRIRGGGYKGPILALSAHSTDDNRLDCLKVGCDDCLCKPIDWNQLAKLIRKFVPGIQEPAPILSPLP